MEEGAWGSHTEERTQAGLQRVWQLLSGRMAGQQHFWQSGTACAEAQRHEKSARFWEESVVGDKMGHGRGGGEEVIYLRNKGEEKQKSNP